MGNQEVELVIIPHPFSGHILATIELAKRLISQDNPRIHTITILYWGLPFIPKADTIAFLQSLVKNEPRIRFVTLPDVETPPPIELFHEAPEAYILEYVKKMVPIVRDGLSTLLSSRDESDSVRVAGLVLDFFCVPMIDVGNEFNLPSYIFLTCSAGFLGMMKYLPERHLDIKSEFNRSFNEELNRVPGFNNSVPTKVLPSGLFMKETYEPWVELAERFPDAKGILTNSFTFLEPNAFEYFGGCPDNYPPVYPIGPILCSNDRPSPNLDSSERDRIIGWLDDQTESSVVFLCFGSLRNIPETQIKEIAQAMELVDCKFLWSIRTDPKEYASPYDALPDGFMDRVMDQGLVCGWAPQVEILAHKAIGGFVSHCGWNSTLESLGFGVPIATWPMYAEQQLNAFTLVKELGVAMELRMDYVSEEGHIVKADEIAGTIRALMDGEDRVLKTKAKQIAEAAKEAVVDGGSSFAAIKRFIGDLIIGDGL
ncbi:PREDICTED: UDP-glycosyltransferase 71C1-like isoform X1 [Camelina sativa]|uniref:Glycosyltransferase n=1 Tax=Camelina sativa TaxID=90675 RepID=A0ABM1RQZ1_CAMSA|nr:PREDICTED: UDP-glycosyltransferase 71C1-like isoform X1 [Camelina sativa]